MRDFHTWARDNWPAPFPGLLAEIAAGSTVHAESEWVYWFRGRVADMLALRACAQRVGVAAVVAPLGEQVDCPPGAGWLPARHLEL